jgi:hypothetical protein
MAYMILIAIEVIIAPHIPIIDVINAGAMSSISPITLI